MAKHKRSTQHGLAHRLIAIGLACASALAPVACKNTHQAPESGNPTVAYNEQTSNVLPPGYLKQYAFSDDWFSMDIPVWAKVFGPLAGKPDLQYLEIGVYEGRAFFWMLENVLTHPTSRGIGIDIFIPSQIEQRFLDNVKLSGQEPRVTTIKGYSQVELRKLSLDSVDIIYVDGSHTADDVLTDAVLAWGLLKNGGFIVFDDFDWDGSYYAGPGSHLPDELLPGLAITSFIQTHRNYLDVINLNWQIILRKRSNPCPNKSMCSPLGDYTYDWKDKQLVRGPNREAIPLTQSEMRALETVFWQRGFRGGRFTVPPSLLETPEVHNLVNRLGLQSELAPPLAREGQR